MYQHNFFTECHHIFSEVHQKPISTMHAGICDRDVNFFGDHFLDDTLIIPNMPQDPHQKKKGLFFTRASIELLRRLFQGICDQDVNFFGNHFLDNDRHYLDKYALTFSFQIYFFANKRRYHNFCHHYNSFFIEGHLLFILLVPRYFLMVI